jgi:two-component system heavy metal sensor histidine kinase CusS
VIQRSIRFRLTAWYALALAAALGLFALAIWVSFTRSLAEGTDAALAQEVHNMESYLNEELQDIRVHLAEELGEYAEGLPTNMSFSAAQQTDEKSTGRIFTSNPGFPQRSTALDSPGYHSLRFHDHNYRLLERDMLVAGHPWKVSFAVQLDESERLVGKLRLLILGLIPAVVAIASAGGYWLSGRALKPVDDITAAARSIGIRNLSQRLVIPQTGDELQRLSETWNSMLDRLEDAVTRLTRFTADASHELRTPLAIIRTTAEIAARMPRPAENYRAALAQIVSESESMTTLVEDLLFLARCDADNLDVPMSLINLATVADEVCTGMRRVAESKSITLRFPDAHHAISIFGNEAAIRRLILILVDNAIKYSQSGGEVELNVRQSGNKILLIIQDQGAGILPAELPHIFERFYRAASARDLPREGSGLGLSLAVGIARHHGANISVSSTPGAGSTFTVSFPVPES